MKITEALLIQWKLQPFRSETQFKYVGFKQGDDENKYFDARSVLKLQLRDRNSFKLVGTKPKGADQKTQQAGDHVGGVGREGHKIYLSLSTLPANLGADSVCADKGCDPTTDCRKIALQSCMAITP